MTERLPSKTRIAEAWESAYGHEVPWHAGTLASWRPQCWACHYYAESWPHDWDKAHGLERCHVIPKSLGGSNDPTNLVLLCERCHEESPDHCDSRYLFRWMRERPKRVQGTWLPEHNDEMARLSKVAVARNISHEQTSAAIKDFVRSSGDHFGWTSDGTRQALLWRLAEEIEGAS